MPNYQTLPSGEIATSVPLTDPSSLPGWKPDAAGFAALSDWLQNSPNSILNGGGSALGNLNLTYDPGPAYDPNAVFKFRTGGTGASGDVGTPVVYQPGQTYTLTDLSGKTLGTANSAEQMQALVNSANQTGAWNLYQGAVTPGAEIARQTDEGSFGSMIVPMLGVAGAALGLGALTGAFAPAAAGAAATGAGGSIAPVAGATGTALSSTAAPVFGDIVVTGTLPGAGLSAGTLAGLGGALGGTAALTAGGSGAAPSAGGAAAEPGDIVVTGQLPTTGLTEAQLADLAAALTVPTAAASTAPSATASQPTSQPSTTTDPNDIVVTGTAQGSPHVSGGLSSLIDQLALPAATSGVTDAMLQQAANAQPTSQPSTLSQISKYLKAAGVATDVFGNLFGGTTQAAVPAGAFSNTGLPSVFSAKLPAAQPQFAAGIQNYAASPNIQNWIVPYETSAAQAPTMAVMPTTQSVQNALNRAATMGVAATNPMAVQPVGKAHGGAIGYAQGGSDQSYAVSGPGTGRSDSIPAKLSDGEYVMDAETVALLGDGSSKAGADKLDQMRVNLRRQKGRNLAKGQFSAKAKEPLAYLSGGRI